MTESRRSDMSGFKLLIPWTIVALTGGVIAIFVWPPGIHAAPLWRFLVGYCLCSFAIFLIAFPTLMFLQLRSARGDVKKSRDGK